MAATTPPRKLDAGALQRLLASQKAELRSYV
jgi:hypothetical protein